MKSLRSGQIDLDFHTSELLPDVGGLFNENNSNTCLNWDTLARLPSSQNAIIPGPTIRQRLECSFIR